MAGGKPMKHKKEILQMRNKLFKKYVEACKDNERCYADASDPGFIIGAWSALGWLFGENSPLFYDD
jgi:hypothetical protein